LCAIIGTFSLAQGLAVWPTATIIWIMHERKAVIKNPFFYIWLVFFILCSTIHAVHAGTTQGLISALVKDPINTLLYFFAFLGNYTHYVIFGMMIFCISIICLVDFIRYNRKNDIFAVALIINYIIIAFLIAISKIHEGVDQAFTSRYLAYSLVLLQGCYYYIHSNNKHLSTRYRLFNVFNLKHVEIILVVVLIASFCVGIRKSINFSEVLKQNAYYFLTYDTQPDSNMKRLAYFNLSFARANAHLLKSLSLNVFYNYNDILADIKDLKPVTINNFRDYIVFDEINCYTKSDDPYIQISGAVINPNMKGPVDAVVILVDTNRYISYYGFHNPVVVKLSRRSRFHKSGFFRAIPVRLLDEGESYISIQFYDRDKQILYDTGKIFRILIMNDNVEISLLYNLLDSPVL
jgi:hypothetical protein